MQIKTLIKFHRLKYNSESKNYEDVQPIPHYAPPRNFSPMENILQIVSCKGHESPLLTPGSRGLNPLPANNALRSSLLQTSLSVPSQAKVALWTRSPTHPSPPGGESSVASTQTVVSDQAGRCVRSAPHLRSAPRPPTLTGCR